MSKSVSCCFFEDLMITFLMVASGYVLVKSQDTNLKASMFTVKIYKA